MYLASLDDCGLSFKAETIKDIVTALEGYIKEEYGRFTVSNLTKDTSVSSSASKIIDSPGEYLIQTNKLNIYCSIKSI